MKAKHLLLVITGLALIVAGEFLHFSLLVGMGLGTFAGGLYYIYRTQVEKRAEKQAAASAMNVNGFPVKTSIQPKKNA